MQGLSRMSTLFVAWQNPRNRVWAPVGRLSDEGGAYKFVYTRGALNAREDGFRPFGRMTDLYAVYESDELFPLFANRTVQKSRPEYNDYMNWLGLSDLDHSVLDELSRTGGIRATDSLELFPCPEPTADRNYTVHFFARGIRYLHPENMRRALGMSSGERLFLMRDLQNQHDKKALLLRADQPVTLVGYVPRYYSAEFSELIRRDGGDDVVVNVERVNRSAPIQYLVLCTLTAPWPANFQPCSGAEFEALAS